MVSQTKSPVGRVRLALTETPSAEPDFSFWIGQLVELGMRVREYSKSLLHEQLIVAVSVPTRHFAAPLIACGWMSKSPAPTIADPLSTALHLAPGTPVRAVTSTKVFTDYFEFVDLNYSPARLHLRSRQWQMDKILALTELPRIDSYSELNTPSVGCISRFTRISDHWNDRLCRPPRDLALIGTLKWLREDLSSFLSTDNEEEYGPPERLHSFLQVGGDPDATWSTRIISPTSIIDSSSLPTELSSVILDGASAIKMLADIESCVVIAVIDRSVADETASEVLLHVRSSRGTPVSVPNHIGWSVPKGIETLAFVVPL